MNEDAQVQAALGAFCPRVCPSGFARNCTLNSAAFAPASGGTARNLPTFHTDAAISSFMTVHSVQT
jgi:hypothetical protein